MPIYFFDTRDGVDLDLDEVGLDCPDLAAARFEAARGLADLARDLIPQCTRREFSIEVREGRSTLLKVSILFEFSRVHNCLELIPNERLCKSRRSVCPD